MPVYSVERSLDIHATREKVFGLVRDFQRWPEWSPWLIAEPNCPLEFAEDGSGYSWEGELIGAGKITLVEEIPCDFLHLHLQFLKPFRSTAHVSFRFDSIPDGTRVTWRMDGKLPWFMFWMKSMITIFVGMDYENGLKLLKDLAELEKVPFQLAFPGIREYPAQSYLSISGTSKTDATIADTIGQAYKDLAAAFTQCGITPESPPFCLYRKFQPTKNRCEFTVGFPYSGKVPHGLPAEVTPARHPGTRAYVVEYTGPYRHLGAAWSAAMTHGRSKKFVTNKKFPPFEVNVNDPECTPEEELVTHIYLPTR